VRETSYPELGILRRGKVRDCYLSGGRRTLVATDRVSAFDVVFAEAIPHKGRVLTEITAHMTELARRIVPVALESRPHPNVLVARECPVFPVEVVVRAYLAGSAWQAYARGERMLSGVRLPEGLTKNARLPAPILTPTTKAETGHDLPISRDEIIGSSLVPRAAYEEMERMALALFELGSHFARERGLILVDTKYEFGDGGDGRPVLIDEIHTPDSSRYWRRASYESRPDDPEPLSKEFLRDWLRARGFSGDAGQPVPTLTADVIGELSARYLDLCTELTGHAPDLSTGSGDLHRDIFEALRNAGHLAGYVAIVVTGSPSDTSNARKVTDMLASLGVPSVLRIVSGHRDPRRLLDLIAWVDRYPGEVVWVDVTGLSNAKGPLLAANTLNPVYHCAFDPTSPDTLSSLNLPGGVPLAVVAGARNTALVVAKQIGVRHAEVRRRVERALADERARGAEADRAQATARRADPEPPASGGAPA
jgi:phosphoribosylaminoimidazole-succinocarboxamide synthase